MDEPLVSICVANYQGAEVIEACLYSLLQQKCNFDFEVIVYDDASIDTSPLIIKERFPEVKLIVGTENIGYCSANWHMAREAKGKFLLLFNNDAVLMPSSLQALADAANSQGERLILGLPQYDAASENLEDRGRLCDLFLNAVPNLDSTRKDVAMVAGACLWISKKSWFDLGGFPEWFEYIAEDLYLCSVARLHDYRIQIVGGEVGFLHHIGHSIGGGKAKFGALSSTISRRYHSERNKSIVMLTCFPSPWHWIGFSILAIFLILEGLILASLMRDLPIFRLIYMRALCDVFNNRQKILKMRRFVQKGVVSRESFFNCFVLFPYKFTLLVRYGFPKIKL